MSKKKSTYQTPETHVLEVEETEHVLDDAVEVLETPTPVQDTKAYVCSESDTYASVASRFCPADVKKHDYAKQLVAMNKNKTIKAGTVIVL